MTIQDLLELYKNNTVILVDLSWLLYRSHYAYSNLTNSNGEPTGSYFGLTRTLQTLTESYPQSLILLVDDGCPVERKQLNESYKANREHTVHFDNKKYNVDCIIQMLPNVYRVYNPVIEADDLLFSISRIKDFHNYFIIYTSDKDLYQALDDSTILSSEIKNNRLVAKDINSEQYIEHFQDLQPFQVPYYRAVLGDPSDNLKIIRPRFPSKVAYYFAKNYIKSDGYEVHVTKPTTKPEDLTDRQYECLLEIYSSTEFMNNLALMKLEFISEIPIIDKNKTSDEVQEVLTRYELRKFNSWVTLVLEGLY